MAMPQLNPVLLAGRVYEVGERVHLATNIEGTYWREGSVLSDGTAFVGGQPPASYGSANSLAGAVFVIYSRAEVARGVSWTTEAERWTYKIAHQLPAQILNVPVTVNIVAAICHMNLSPVRFGQPDTEAYVKGQTVYLTKGLSVVSNDPSGKAQNLKEGFELEIRLGPRSRTQDAILDSSKAKNFRGNRIYYDCRYNTVEQVKGCYWKSNGQIAHQFIRPFP